MYSVVFVLYPPAGTIENAFFTIFYFQSAGKLYVRFPFCEKSKRDDVDAERFCSKVLAATLLCLFFDTVERKALLCFIVSLQILALIISKQQDGGLSSFYHRHEGKSYYC